VGADTTWGDKRALWVCGSFKSVLPSQGRCRECSIVYRIRMLLGIWARGFGLRCAYGCRPASGLGLRLWDRSKGSKVVAVGAWRGRMLQWLSKVPGGKGGMAGTSLHEEMTVARLGSLRQHGITECDFDCDCECDQPQEYGSCSLIWDIKEDLRRRDSGQSVHSKNQVRKLT
jgi:hypothetical protein